MHNLQFTTVSELYWHNLDSKNVKQLFYCHTINPLYHDEEEKVSTCSSVDCLRLKLSR